MRYDFMKRDGVTFANWLRGTPSDFQRWPEAYGHWDQGNPVGWALYCWRNARKI